jgi:hypothetical protein
MSLYTLLHVCSDSKAKRVPRLVMCAHAPSRRFPVAPQDKEVCHAL